MRTEPTKYLASSKNPTELKWSPTIINASKGCIRRFQKEFIEYAPYEVNIPEFEEGSRIHSLVQQYLETKNLKYIEEFNDTVKRDLEIILSHDGELKTEVAFEDERCKGQADIVIEQDDSWVVVEVKSRYNNEIDNDVKIQLYFYLYMLQKQRQKNKAKIGMLAVYNPFNPLILLDAEIINADELERYVNHQIELAERRIAHGKINTSYCRYCHYIKSCDFKVEPEDIESIAQKYVQLQSLIKQYEFELKQHVDHTGKNINIDGLEIGYHPRNTTLINAEELMDMASGLNLKVLDLFKPDVLSIKKLSKKYPELANAVEIKSDYYFTVKKIIEIQEKKWPSEKGVSRGEVHGADDSPRQQNKLS